MAHVTPVLHSVSYAGVWPGQARLTLDEFVDKAAELGFPALMLMAKRPHLSVLDYSPEACLRLRERIEKKGLKVQVIAGYNNFSADAEHGDVPHREIQIAHVTDLARMAKALAARGFDVSRAATAAEALELARHDSPEYAEALTIRQRAATSRMLIVDGLDLV